MEMYTRMLLLGILVIILNFVSVCSKRKVFEERQNVTKKSENSQLSSFQYDAKEAWLALNENEKLEEKREKRKKRKKKKTTRQMELEVLPGPQGPKEPSGSSVDHITMEGLMPELRKLLKEATKRRKQLALQSQCKKKRTGKIKTKSDEQYLSPSIDIDHVSITPKVTWSFLWQLKDDVWLNSNSINEISNYYKPYSPGSHDRCQSFVSSRYNYNCQNNSSHNIGKYEVPKSGFYTFYVNFHLKKNSSCETDPSDSIEVLLCINSQCEENVSLRTITNLKNSTFTVSINGILHLKKNQYTSVYVDNRCRCSIVILKNSKFVGFLSGY